ncbi:alpha/beta hydrolase [Telmatospirillum sp.]|uniref:alpha/beta hydrolase n=1 Tax=Telmatospirillum sp. TaxID=2079197 RepID=UPI00283F14FD|nr:alpha/beta hydrolase [Telmatospirillum sp.]MDR3436815.1 lysophospholipase [Telmatospirillum sp.]
MRRLPILAVMIGFLLSACTPTIMEPGPRITEARLDTDAIVADDGVRLPLRSWLPPGDPEAVVIGLHGFNDYSLAFDDPGKVLAEAGIAVYAYDQRGFGAAPDTGYWAGEKAMTDDLIAAIRLLSARYPGKPLYLLGESMGGAVVMVTMARPDAPKVAGIILSAPAVWGRTSMSIVQRAALWIASHTMPWMTLTGRGLHIRPSDNIDMLRRLSRDPLVIKETRVDAIHGLCDLMDDAARSPAKLHVATLLLYGDNDEVVPAEPTLAAMAALPDDPKAATHALYASGYHMLLRDLEAKIVLNDIIAWIRNPAAPLPSGADQRANDRLADCVKSGELPAR